MEFHRSARRHGIDHETIQHVVDNAIVVVDIDEHADPPKVLVIGPDSAGNLARSSSCNSLTVASW